MQLVVFYYRLKNTAYNINNYIKLCSLQLPTCCISMILRIHKIGNVCIMSMFGSLHRD
jgi:hypothetical protein